MRPYKFSELPYVPTDFDAIQQQLQQYIDQIRSADSAKAIFAVVESCDAMIDDLKYASTLAYIRSSLDCTDEFYAEAMQKEAMGSAMMDTSPYYQALLESPFLPQLEQRFGPEYCPRLEKEYRLHAAGRELMAQEQLLVNQYQQSKAMMKIPFRGKNCSDGEILAFFDNPDRMTRVAARKAMSETYLAQKENFAPLLTQLVGLRQQIAVANGFDNYLEYANAGYDRRGYGEAELTAFCEQVKTDLVPLLRELQEEQRRELGVDKLMTYDRGLRFADGNAVPAGDARYLTEASKTMYDALAPEFGAFFRGMVDTESLDVTASPNKVAGMGFCTGIGRDRYPFVFGNCNGTDTDVAVFTHEIGHAWQMHLTSQQGYTALLEDMALDVVEIPSKTMELFTYPYAEEFFGRDANKFRQGHFRDALREIAAYCAIHELNTWIYTHPDATFEEIVEANTRIEVLYDPDVDYGELETYNRQGANLMRNMAVYMFPRYVISYALSAMCAMDLFARMQTDPAAAWEAYTKLCASGGSRCYPDTLAQAGLSPAYAPGSVKTVVTFAKQFLGI